MKQIILLLFFHLVTAFDCSQYSQQGCPSCVANINTLTDGCVWCGLVDTEDGVVSGNCYYYDDINQACQNFNINNVPIPLTQIYLDIQSYGCCNQQFRIGSNIEVTCQSNYTSIVTSKMNHVLLIYFIYFWIIGSVAIFYIHYVFGRNFVYSLFMSSIFPLLSICIFFFDTNLNPNSWYW